jgi:uncharacterized protein (TIGR02444 family)
VDRADAADLWNFALTLYAAPGVADACLALQDAQGVDVPLLIYAAWAARHGCALEASDVARADARIRNWRKEVIVPLRGVRRWLKSALPLTGPAEKDALREAVKTLELQAERLALEALASGGLAGPASRATVAPHHLAPVIAHFGGAFADQDIARHLRIVAAAASAI